jgi:RIO-like serine/threonine protein kinase
MKVVIIIKLYGGYDIDKLECIGRGIHGKVYKIDSKRCIKIFKKVEFYEKELETLRMVQNDEHFPKLYEWGDRYIVREYIEGIELDKYLKDNLLTPIISIKLIDLYEAIVKAGFSRHDTMLFHIFITQDGTFKMIDTARVMKEKCTYPKLIIKGLKDLGCRDEFLDHVKLLRPELYVKWIDPIKSH